MSREYGSQPDTAQNESGPAQPGRLTHFLKRLFVGSEEKEVIPTAQPLQTQMQRREFLRLAGAGAAAVALTALPREVRGQGTEATSDVPTDAGNPWPTEEYHFRKNEVRALYERVIADSGYKRFLFAVSQDYPLPADFPRDSAEIPVVDALSLGLSAREQVPVAELAAEPLSRMFADARAVGFSPYLTSGFRSIAYQEGLFERNIQGVMQAQSISREEATAKVSQYSAPPGTSEHHLGLAYDILEYPGQSWDEARRRYDTGLFAWLRKYAALYGFVLSFPTGQSEYTAKDSAAVISAEPWHLRYVGQEVAAYFMESNYLNFATSASVHTLLIDPYFES